MKIDTGFIEFYMSDSRLKFEQAMEEKGYKKGMMSFHANDMMNYANPEIQKFWEEWNHGTSD